MIRTNQALTAELPHLVVQKSGRNQPADHDRHITQPILQ